MNCNCPIGLLGTVLLLGTPLFIRNSKHTQIMIIIIKINNIRQVGHKTNQIHKQNINNARHIFYSFSILHCCFFVSRLCVSPFYALLFELLFEFESRSPFEPSGPCKSLTVSIAPSKVGHYFTTNTQRIARVYTYGHTCTSDGVATWH